MAIYVITKQCPVQFPTLDFADIAHERELHRLEGQPHGDGFLPVPSEFLDPLDEIMTEHMPLKVSTAF